MAASAAKSATRVPGFFPLDMGVNSFTSIRELIVRFGKQQAKRPERARWDEPEFHQTGATQRELFQWHPCFLGIGDVQNKHDPGLVLLDEPLIELARQVELHSLAYFRWQDGFQDSSVCFWCQATDREELGGRDAGHGGDRIRFEWSHLVERTEGLGNV
jgi:hypothetical protein